MFLDQLREHARNRPDEAALRIKRDDKYQEWSFSQVWRQALSAAASLRERGLEDGDRVALFADNCPEWVIAYLGVVASGGVVVPLDAQYGKRELKGLLTFAECRIAIHGESTRKRLEEALPETGIEETLPLEGDSPLFRAEPLDEPRPRDDGETMAVIFTSGTTGDPKGVCLSPKNISSNIDAIIRRLPIIERDNVLGLLPLHHCYALTVSALTPLVAACPVTFCLSLRGPDIVAAAQETGVTCIIGVPRLFEGFDRAMRERIQGMGLLKRGMFGAMLGFSRGTRKLTGLNPGNLLFRSVRKRFGDGYRLIFASGGAKLDAAITSRFLDMGIPLVEGYGLTETGPVLTFNPLEKPKPGSVGTALDNVEIRIVESEKEATEGVGEVTARGPNIMLGYLKRPDETAEVLKDGWFHTGDLGYLDDKGYLFLTGRAKEVIVLASGKNVYPAEVESHYEQSPLVEELCVMPAEEPDGRVANLQAVVVPDFDELRRRGERDSYAAVRAAFQRLSKDLPSYMRVNKLSLVSSELPRTRLGKLKREEIQSMALEEVERDATRQLSPEEERLLSTRGTQELLQRIAELSGKEGAPQPGDHLELDLGLDSLARVELGVILERDFALKIPDEEVPNIATVGDLLERLTENGGQPRRSRSWGDLLQERAQPPLTEMFNIDRSRLSRNAVHCVRRFVFRIGERALSIDMRGFGNLPKDRPFLLCPSHASFIDAPLVFAALPSEIQEKMFFIAAQVHFDHLLMRNVAQAARVILLASTATLLPALRRTAEAVQLGCPVCVFPEGGITRDGYLQRPQLGSGIIACETGVPIVPVLVRGTYDLLSYANPGLHLRPIGMTCGAPIEPPGKRRHTNEDYKAIMEEWARAIARMRELDDLSGGPTAGRSPRIPQEWKTP